MGSGVALAQARRSMRRYLMAGETLAPWKMPPSVDCLICAAASGAASNHCFARGLPDEPVRSYQTPAVVVCVTFLTNS